MTSTKTAHIQRIRLLLGEAIWVANNHRDVDRPKDAIRMAFREDINGNCYTTNEKVDALEIFSRGGLDIEGNEPTVTALTVGLCGLTVATLILSREPGNGTPEERSHQQ